MVTMLECLVLQLHIVSPHLMNAPAFFNRKITKVWFQMYKMLCHLYDTGRWVVPLVVMSVPPLSSS